MWIGLRAYPVLGVGGFMYRVKHLNRHPWGVLSERQGAVALTWVRSLIREWGHLADHIMAVWGLVYGVHEAHPKWEGRDGTRE